MQEMPVKTFTLFLTNNAKEKLRKVTYFEYSCFING